MMQSSVIESKLKRLSHASIRQRLSISETRSCLQCKKRGLRKSRISPSSVLKMIKTDFFNRKSRKKNLSYDDKKFIKTMHEFSHVTVDNHYEMPLPFKTSYPVLPNNRQHATRKLDHLNIRLQSYPSNHQEYTAYMNEILDSGYAEEVLTADRPKKGRVLPRSLLFTHEGTTSCFRLLC